MDTQDHKQLVFHDSAILFRIVGGIFAVGSLAFLAAKMMVPGISFVAAGLSLLVFSSDLIIVADRSTHILKLEVRYLFFHGARKILFDDIDNIQAQRHVNSSKGSYSVGYRIIVTLFNGKTVPFRLFYSGGDEKNIRQRSCALLSLAVEPARPLLAVTNPMKILPPMIFQLVGKPGKVRVGASFSKLHRTNLTR
jgi:hypothetical protein